MNRDEIEEKWGDRFAPRWGHWWPREGWFNLIDEALTMLAEMRPDFQLHQVKEKFGGLRIYTSYDGDKEVREAMAPFIARAYSTCEWCGSEEDTRQNDEGWILTLCADCHTKRDAGGKAPGET